MRKSSCRYGTRRARRDSGPSRPRKSHPALFPQLVMCQHFFDNGAIITHTLIAVFVDKWPFGRSDKQFVAMGTTKPNEIVKVALSSLEVLNLRHCISV